MTITYTWKITGLKTRQEGNNKSAVTQTYWQKIGTDENGNTANFSGATPFTSTTMPEGDVFVPFDQLTEAMVLKWIQDAIPENSDYEQHINGTIAKQLSKEITPIVETPLPWAAPSQVPTAPV